MREREKLGDLERLYLAYYAPIRNYLYHLGGDFALAEDLVQETFYRAGRSLLLKGKIVYVSSWLYTIARHLYLDHLKKRGAPQVSLERLPEPQHPRELVKGRLPEEALEEKQLRERVRATLLALGEKQRTALLLKDYQDLTCQEIGAILGISPVAVKSLLHRARLAFRRRYNALGKDETHESPRL